ncbi:MAG: hypothetical protein JXB45_11620 [Candidatus Krumholzibacteriota bacterium]|nr:hypothetical protein [Candidatus Krumholzibacteriota bacterium]
MGSSLPLKLTLWILLILAAILMFKGGAFINSSSDLMDHAGTVREIVETRRIFPVNSFYAGGEGLGPDPRKGFFHVCVAMICIISGVEPFSAMFWMPTLMLPLLLCAFFTFTRGIFDDRNTALVSVILFFLCFKGLDRGLLRSSGYPLYAALLVYLVAIYFMFRYLRHRRLGFLLGSALLGYTAGTIHIYYFVQLCLALFAFFIFSLIINRKDRELLAGLVKIGLIMLLVSIPFLIIKYQLSYSISNPYDSQPRHLLYLTKNIFVVNPLRPWNMVGPLGALALVLTPFLFRRAKESRGLLFLFSGMVTTVLIIFNPLAVYLLGKFMTYGLVRRFTLLAPYIAVAGFFTHRNIMVLIREGDLKKKLGAAAFLLLLLLILVPYAVSFFRVYSPRSLEAEKKESPLVWIDALEFLEEEIATPSVILSDPYTSFSIPALTKHYIVAVPIGHSSPKDADNVFKVKQAGDALSGYTGLNETLAILDKYKVTYIVLNQRFAQPVYEYAWSIDPRLYKGSRDKFDSAPALFEKVYQRDNLYIYRYNRSRDRRIPVYEEPVARPFILSALPEAVPRVEAEFYGRFVLLAASLDKEAYRPGENIQVDTYWGCLRKEMTPKQYKVFIRFDTTYEKKWFYSERFSKLYRRMLQLATGRRYRFRAEFNPVSGIYPPDAWKENEIVADKFRISVPRDVAEGVYEVKIKLLDIPFNPNYSLSDLLSDRDVYDGVKVGTVRIGE